ncbi:MAG: hypothetical protein R2794_11715 [Chitinophagales bacterium]
MIDLSRYDNDDPDFIFTIEIIIRYKVDKWKPRDLYITRIDNWFDDKWLRFSGKIFSGLSIWKLKDVTVPPFHPNRVVSCDFYQLGNDSYKKQELIKPLHIIQTSKENPNRKIADITDNGLFIWFSSNSKTNNIGTLMGYLGHDSECYTFYISLTGDKNWNVHKTIGISTKEIHDILGTTGKRK